LTFHYWIVCERASLFRKIKNIAYRLTVVNVRKRQKVEGNLLVKCKMHRSTSFFLSFFLELKICCFFFCKRPSVCFFCNKKKKNLKLKTCFSIKCLIGGLCLLFFLFFFFADDRFSSRKRDASLVRNLRQFEPRFELLNSSIIYSEPFSVITGCLCLWE
jgi:lipid-A-disaccharide synthase-like uncharacterized protein